MTDTTNPLLSQKWIIRYIHSSSDNQKVYREILEALSQNENNNIHPPYSTLINLVDFDNPFNPSQFKITQIEKTDLPENLLKTSNLPQIKRIGLSYPVMSGDKRWNTISLTSASLFLGSQLTKANFQVISDKQILPALSIDSRFLQCHLLGYTLFEDLFQSYLEFFSRLKESYTGLIAAGGPMVTLSPLQTAFHLPHIDLLIRGEAELVFPKILNALNTNNVSQLLENEGFLFKLPGLIVISDLGKINRPDDFQSFDFNLDFLEKKHLDMGIELNISRGCKRGCIFCSSVQGKKFRKLPIKTVENLLSEFSKKQSGMGIEHPHAHTININDDDILQEPEYAKEIFDIIKKTGFRLWGIQTSVNSLFSPNGLPHKQIIDLVDDKSLFVEGKPLFWAGTDAFLVERGKKLGKIIPSETQLKSLTDLLEKKGIEHYHYWISSDYKSNWNEFTNELMLICYLLKNYTRFHIIAHAPFLVPYSTTPLYRLLASSEETYKQIKFKKILSPSSPFFKFPLPQRVETPFLNLNRMLLNEKQGQQMGFFDYFEEKDFPNLWISVYNFIKADRLDAESNSNIELTQELIKLERELETYISNLL